MLAKSQFLETHGRLCRAVCSSPLPLIAVAAAIAYGVRLDFDSKTFSIALKMSPALLMACEVYRRCRRAAWPMVAALLFHAAGDGLLNLGSRYFLAGMATFFVGHLGYIAAFWPQSQPYNQLSIQRRVAIAVLVVLMVALTLYIWPMLPGIQVVASPLYSIALTAMAVTALFGQWSVPWVAVGAILFVVSDVLLGLRLFVDMHAFSFAIWPAYAAAQILIPLGYLQTMASARRRDADVSGV